MDLDGGQGAGRRRARGGPLRGATAPCPRRLPEDAVRDPAQPHPRRPARPSGGADGAPPRCTTGSPIWATRSKCHSPPSAIGQRHTCPPSTAPTRSATATTGRTDAPSGTGQGTRPGAEHRAAEMTLDDGRDPPGNHPDEASPPPVSRCPESQRRSVRPERAHGVRKAGDAAGAEQRQLEQEAGQDGQDGLGE